VYTQCSKCETVFRLSAEVLRAAGGQVRCGKCGEVFNALARLAEDSSAFSAGESSLEMETRADNILGSLAAMQVAEATAEDHEEFVPPGVEIAQLEILDANADDSDRSMEFTLPPGELDRIFVESKKRVPMAPAKPDADDPHGDAQDGAHLELRADPQPDSQADPHAIVEADIDFDIDVVVETDADAHSDTHPAVHSDLAVAVETDADPAPDPAPALAPDPAPVLAPHPESAAAASAPAPDHVSGLEVPDDVRRDMLAEFEPPIRRKSVARDPAPLNAQRRLILWLGAAIGSALLLVVQVVHQNREWFTAHVYRAMGAPLPQPANLSAFELRQWGVTGDPDANGTLRLRASILNTAAQLQPYPLLRVTLADRFGKSIGARDFEPTEYLGKPTARLLTPGERVDATLEILDPGKNAEGFEIDVCVRGVDKRISCANDVAAQATAR
jgi:predicted Zn finger-like uncharacterized protein